VTQRAQAIGFAGTVLDCPRYICAFFNSDEEEYRTLLPFIRVCSAFLKELQERRMAVQPLLKSAI
jgi:hypothetical protein